MGQRAGNVAEHGGYGEGSVENQLVIVDICIIWIRMLSEVGCWALVIVKSTSTSPNEITDHSMMGHWFF